MSVKNINQSFVELNYLSLLQQQQQQQQSKQKRHFFYRGQLKHIVYYNNYGQLVVVLLLILITAHLTPFVNGVPLTVQVPDSKIEAGENSLSTQFQRIQQSRSPYCRYKAGTYSLGDEVQTEEPCLKCHCQRTAVVCKLRMCREMPNPPPPGCIVVHRAKKCCSELVCPDGNRKNSREHRLSAAVSNISLIQPQTTVEKGFCIYEGTVYAEGSAMQSSSLCEYCFCIRGEMKCSSPQCVIPLNGCKPKFRSYACCPTNYDCNESNATAILQTIPTTTIIPKFLKGCQVQGRFIQDGEPVLPIQLEEDMNHINLCQTCFCMGGIVRCRPLECDRPIEGCLPITSDGHCCPDRYDCSTTTTTTMTTTTTISPHSSSSILSYTTNINKIEKSKNENVSNGSSILPTSLIQIILNNNNEKINNNKNKSEMIGSREQRRNRDKDDFAIALKTSYEHEDDNGKEESLSFEHIEHDHSSSISIEGTSEQSNSKLEIDTIIEPASETEFPDTSSNEDNNDISSSNIVTEKENELDEFTTTITPQQQQTVANNINVLPIIEPNNISIVVIETNLTSITPTTTTVLPEIYNNITVYSTERPSPTSFVLESIPNSNNNSSTSFVSIPIEKMTTNTILLNETTPTTTTTSSIPPSISTTTINNLHFIPFGVEDALIEDPNIGGGEELEPIFTKYGSSPPLPIKIVYDKNALRTSLIQPTPPKGYIHVPLKIEPTTMNNNNNNNDEIKKNNPIITIPSIDNNNNFKNELILKNNHHHVVDIPVSTSLYNNGYFNNGLVVPSTNLSGFPGHIFEQEMNEDDVTKNNDDKKKDDDIKKLNITNINMDSSSINLNNNPLRTYSKFGIQDAPFYRSGFDTTTTTTASTSTSTTNKNLPILIPKSKSDDIPGPEGRNDDDHRYYERISQIDDSSSQQRFNPYTDYDQEDTYDQSLEKDVQEQQQQQQQKLLNNNYRYENYEGLNDHKGTTIYKISKTTGTIKLPSTTTTESILLGGIKTKRPTSFYGGFKPVVAFPFMIPKNKPLDSLFNIGLKLSGCNIYGKMYLVGKIIIELSSPCLQCECTEIGVQCTELPC